MRGRPGVRASRAVVLGVIVFALSTSCSSGGTHIQSFSPSSPADHTTSTSGSTSSSPSHTSSSANPTASAIRTPTVTPPAQAAVDNYVTFLGLVNAASADPAHADTARFALYATGQA
jgi:hypothetical protein